VISAGQRTAFDVVGTAGGWLPTTVDDVREEIIKELGPYFRVHNVTIKPTSAIYEMLEWQFLSLVEASPLVSYGSFEDAASVVAHAVYEATGHMPAVTGRGQGLPHEPGSSWIDGVGLPSVGDGLSGIGKAIEDFFKGLQETTSLLLVGAVVVLVVIAVSVGGKTTRVGVKL